MFECGDHLTDEELVTVSRKRVVREKQQSVVVLSGIEATPMTAHQVWNVVGHQGATLFRCVIKDETVVDASQVTGSDILHPHHIVPMLA
jgi:hypothetical protein